MLLSTVVKGVTNSWLWTDQYTTQHVYKWMEWILDDHSVVPIHVSDYLVCIQYLSLFGLIINLVGVDTGWYWLGLILYNILGSYIILLLLFWAAANLLLGHPVTQCAWIINAISCGLISWAHGLLGIIYKQQHVSSSVCFAARSKNHSTTTQSLVFYWGS